MKKILSGAVLAGITLLSGVLLAAPASAAPAARGPNHVHILPPGPFAPVSGRDKCMALAAADRQVLLNPAIRCGYVNPDFLPPNMPSRALYVYYTDY